jgi:cyclophilin family peptidyl-prolyl cis-trans isomerase
VLIPGGDPRGDGSGGPGYRIDAEFNDREHRPGVLSMSRQTDPLERAGALPRPDYANSAGSQFFISLNYGRTRQFDRRYTAFARVIDGMNVVESIGQAPTDQQTESPLEPVVIRQVQVLPVDAAHNPYPTLLSPSTTQPADAVGADR